MSELTLLIVDDEVDMVELVQVAFERRGYAVIGALNGRDGLRLACEHRPAIILVDLLLPEIDGFELCRQLRANPITARIPVVILSARDSLVDQADALAAGADRYLAQSVGMKVLAGVVDGLIGSAV